jgi:rhodanese-related sulfurtransferase
MILKVILVALVVMFPVWDLLWSALGVKQIYPWELKKNITRDPPFVIDVRTPLEYRFMRMKKSVNRHDLLLNSKNLPFSFEQPLVVVCMTGHRSPIVAWKLKKMGYKNVTNLVWGLTGWKLFGGETESSRTQ